MNKTIHIYYVNRIKHCLGRIFEAEDGWEENPNSVISQNNRAIEHWLDKAGIKDETLRQELLDNIDWCWDCADNLRKIGWTIVSGKENI